MTLKCYKKPNRSKPRFFRMCDAARVAREVVRDNPGDTPEEVLACIAKGLGFTHISLSRPRTIQAASLPVPVGKIPVLIENALRILKAIVAKYGWLGPLLKNIIDLLDELRDVIEFFTTPDQAKVDDVIGEGKCDCKKEVASTVKLIGQSK